MKIYKKSILLSSALTLITVSLSHAYTYTSSSVLSDLTTDELKKNYDQRDTDDYGYAPDSYEKNTSGIIDKAKHNTSEWNFLGRDSKTDDGVLWSTDGGKTWGNGTVSVGDKIQFKITLWSAGYGRHDYDQVKAWVDWNQDGTWTNDNKNKYNNNLYTANETILAAQYYKTDTGKYDAVHADPGRWEDKIIDNEEDDVFTTFTTSDFLIDATMIGQLWLRARAQCNHVPYNQMDPTGFLNQGEVEDYVITVKPVPEPATMLLFGSGLVSFAAVSRKKRS